MGITNTKTDMYGVARGDTLLHIYPTITEAQQQVRHIEDTMRRIGLEPDIYLATVTKTDTYTKPKAYKPDVTATGTPTDATASVEPTPEG